MNGYVSVHNQNGKSSTLLYTFACPQHIIITSNIFWKKICWRGSEKFDFEGGSVFPKAVAPWVGKTD